MNERHQSERFNRALEDLLVGKPVDESQLPAEDREALRIARRLAGEGFDESREGRRQLRAELAARAEAEIGHPSRLKRIIQGLQALYQPVAWGGLALVLVLLLAWAFQNLAADPEPAATLPASPTAGQLTATPDEAVGVIPTPTPLPSTEELLPTPTIQAAEIGPYLTAPGLYFLGWSPDGEWLAFLTQTELDLLNSPVGEGLLGPQPGTVHFTNVRNGGICQFPQENERGVLLNRWFAWLPDGRLITLTVEGELVALDSPCQDGEPEALLSLDLGLEPIEEVYAAGHDNQILLARGAASCWIVDLDRDSAAAIESCAPQASFSPDETYLSVDIFEEPNYHTNVFRVETGDLAGRVDWQFSAGGLGSLPPPTWLGASRFVIYRSDHGPLLADVMEGFQIQPIAETYFGIDGHAYQYPDVLVSPDGEAFHILLTDLGPEASGDTRIYLYHSENNLVEELPYVDGDFTQNGNLFLLQRSIASGYEQSTYWFRPVDPPGSPEQLIVAEQDQPYIGVPKDGELIARASPSSEQLRDQPAGSRESVTISLLDSASGTVLQEWHLNPYTFTFAFSPDNHYLASVGTPISGGLQALYLLPLDLHRAGPQSYNLEELGVELTLPPGYTLSRNPEDNRRGSIAAYDLTPPSFETPYLGEVQFFTTESIQNFLDNCQGSSEPCFFGDYPDLERYEGQRSAYAAGQDFENYPMQRIGERYYFVSSFPCEGDDCLIREYTTFIGEVKVDVWAFLADEAESEAADSWIEQINFQP